VIAHRKADPGAGVSIDIELEIEGEVLTVEHYAHGLAVAHPLCAGKEGLEGVPQRELIGRAAGTLARQAHAMGLEDVRDELAPHGHPQVMAHMLGEVEEGAVPLFPRGEDSFDMGQPGLLVVASAGRVFFRI
jgi:hypothetical protein